MKRNRRWAIPIALVVAVIVAAGCGSEQGSNSMGAEADWTTNGGATSNQRYSTLDEIDTFGDADLVRSTVAGYRQAGIEVPIVMPLPWGADRRQSLYDTIDALA